MRKIYKNRSFFLRKKEKDKKKTPLILKENFKTAPSFTVSALFFDVDMYVDLYHRQSFSSVYLP